MTLYITPGGRVYDSSIGRFLQKDPLAPPGTNPYVYANNNPLSFVDPDGMAQTYTNPDVAANHTELERWTARLAALLKKKADAEARGIPVSDVLLKDIEEKRAMISKFQAQLKQAEATQAQWNKLDNLIDRVVAEYNNKYFKKYASCCPKGTRQLDPNLLKALMFSESEMGAGVQYGQLVAMARREYEAAIKAGVPLPGWIYQVNLGRVTDAAVYNRAVKEFGITRTYSDIFNERGTESDVRLAAAALMIKLEEGCKLLQQGGKGLDPKKDVWFNAVEAYKGVSGEGKAKAQRVWDLYKKGSHPYGDRPIIWK